MMINTPPALRYASFWWRFLAWCIDQLVLCTLFVVLMVYPPIVWPATYIIGWLYYAFCESSRWQGTLGKRACNLVVVNAENYDTLTFARASGRYFARLLSVLTFGIGFLMPFFTLRKQTLHDRVADTLVLKL